MSDGTHSDAMLRLRFLIASAPLTGEEGLPAAQPHPDAALLEMCATYLDLCAEADAIDREARRQPSPCRGNPEFDAARGRCKEKEMEAKCILARLGKTQAATAAGVYAKATIVVTKRGYMSAPNFMLSLAEDLVRCPGLRAILWPAGEG